MTIAELQRMLEEVGLDHPTDIVVKLPYSKLYREIDSAYVDVEGRLVLEVVPGWNIPVVAVQRGVWG